MKHYFLIKDKDEKCHKLTEEKVAGVANCQSLTFLTQFLTLEEAKKYLMKVKIPRNVDIIPQSIIVKTEPPALKYLYRNLLKYLEYDEAKRQTLHQDMEKYYVWKKNQQKEAFEFGLKERNQDEREKEYSIQERIINSRKTNVAKETYQMCKENLISTRLDSIYEKYFELHYGTDPEPEQKSLDKQKGNKKKRPKNQITKTSESLKEQPSIPLY